MRLDFRFFRKQSKTYNFAIPHRPVIAGDVCVSVCVWGGGGGGCRYWSRTQKGIVKGAGQAIISCKDPIYFACLF